MRGSMVRAAGMAFALLTAAPAAQADGGADEKSVRQALASWAEAFNAGDGERVCDLFAPDLIAVYQGVPNRGFAELCAHLRGVLALEPAGRQEIVDKPLMGGCDAAPGDKGFARGKPMVDPKTSPEGHRMALAARPLQGERVAPRHVRHPDALMARQVLRDSRLPRAAR